MEIHENATRSTMIQAIAHNLSTIDRDLDMLLTVALSRHDVQLRQFAGSVQTKVHAAYADALAEYGISLAEVTEDLEGHIHHDHPHNGSERSFIQLLDETTKLAQADETR